MQKIGFPTGTNQWRMGQSFQNWLHKTRRVDRQAIGFTVTEQVLADFIADMEAETRKAIKQLAHVDVWVSELEN